MRDWERWSDPGWGGIRDALVQGLLDILNNLNLQKTDTPI